MEELSIEEKAKAYDAALETVQEMLSSGIDAIRIKTLKLRLQSVFPELAESKDEKNIKDLIDELKCSLRMAECQNYTCGGHEKRIALLEWGITWLKKQGKQKQTWKPSAAQLIVIKDLIEDENTSKVYKVILRGMFDEFKQYFKL